MNDELKQAVERMKRVIAGESYIDVYTARDIPRPRYDRDCELLAHAYLDQQSVAKQTATGFFVAFDDGKPPQLWVWRGEPGDEAAEPWQRVIVG